MSVRVVRWSGIDAARNAHGTAIVIDVLRAFTTAAYAFGGGARTIELVATAEEAFARRREDPRVLLVGEIDGRPIPGFDFGNSPAAIAGANMKDRTLVLRSSSGTQGAMLASHAGKLLLGSLVVASATARAARAANMEVHIVALGAPNSPDIEEDEACADLLECVLLERAFEVQEIVARVRSSPAAQRGYDPAVEWISREDVEHALDIDRFDFAMLARREHGRLIARAERVS